jgi:hypothetical protein
MKKYLLLLFVSANAFTALMGQQIDRIDTDRPDQTESFVTVPKKYFQGEFGFGIENLKYRNYNIAHPSFLFKYGLSKKMELRLEGGVATEYVQLTPNPKKSIVFNPLQVGAKIALLEEKGLMPATSLLFHFGLPFTASNYDKGQNVFPSFRFSFQNSLSQHIALGYNLGAEWNGYDGKPTWIYTLAPGFEIGRKWYAYIEVFGFIRNGEHPKHNLDAGVAYYISNNIKIDFSSGVGVGKNNPLRNYSALGFSFRVPTFSVH